LSKLKVIERNSSIVVPDNSQAFGSDMTEIQFASISLESYESVNQKKKIVFFCDNASESETVEEDQSLAISSMPPYAKKH
jgi:hypothetical protein